MPPPPTLPELLSQRPWLDAFARRLATGPEAEDVVQDVWVRALRQPPRSGRSLRGWLATVARSVTIDRQRASARRQLREQAVAGGTVPASMIERVEAREVRTTIATSLAAVSEPYRSTLWLHYGAGTPVAEVAHIQDVPLETVRTRLRRGRDLLRTQLERTLGASDHARDDERRKASLGLAGMGAAMTGKTGWVLGGAALLALLAVGGVVALLGSQDAATPTGTTQEGLATRESPDTTVEPAPALRGRSHEHGEPPSASEPIPAPLVRREPTEASALPHGKRTIAVPLRDAAGRPLTDTAVTTRITWEASSGDDRSSGQTTHNVRTDAAGHLRLPVLGDADAYVLDLRVPGYVPVRVRVDPEDLPPTLELRQARPLVCVFVTDDPRIRLEGRRVGLVDSGSIAHAISVLGTLDESGTLRFDDLDPAKTYRLKWANPATVEPDGFLRPAPLADTTYRPSDEPYEVQVVPGTSLKGRVTLDGGDPGSVTFRLEALREVGEGHDYANRRFLQTSRGGGFAFEGLEPGTYTLLVYGAATHAPLRVPSVSASSQDVVLDVQSGFVMKGRVVDDGGNLVTGGTVYVSESGRGASEPGGSSTLIGSDGTFETAAVDPRVRLDLYVTHLPGCRSTHLRDLVPTTDTLRVVVERGDSIEGVVRDTLGAPIAHLFVQASSTDSDLPENQRNGGTYADAQGRFRIYGLGPVSYKLLAGGISSAYAGTPRSVIAGAKDVVLTVERGKSMALHLTYEDTSTPSKGRVYAIDPGTRQAWNANPVGEGGVYQFPGLPARTLRFGFHVDGDHVPLGSFVPEGGKRTLVLPSEDEEGG